MIVSVSRVGIFTTLSGWVSWMERSVGTGATTKAASSPLEKTKGCLK
jgi:uncharacterized iron-regulated membrane protein